MNAQESVKPETKKDPRFSPPAVSLPKGGGAIKGIGEKFAANPVTGTGSLSIPLPLSPGRSGFTPALGLAYDSGAGNGPFGFGWSIDIPSITRRTDKGIPKYFDEEESDVFILSGAEDLVPELNDEPPRDGYRITRYRPRIEGLFARIERWSNLSDPADTFWRSMSRDNVTSYYGRTEASRIADPADASKIFSWLICQTYDDKGNAAVYEYQKENSDGVDLSQAHEKNRSPESREAGSYLKRVKYGNRTPNRNLSDWVAFDPTRLPDETWMFELVFDYGESHYSEEAPDIHKRVFARATKDVAPGSHWPVRQEPFSSYRSGFEVRTYRLCRRVLMFHHFPDDLGVSDYLVRSTEFTYSQSRVASFIDQVTQSGYVRQSNDTYLKKSLPPLDFRYSKATINHEIETIDPQSLENLPIGVDGSQYQWLDLDGEGLQNVLFEQPEAWYYKRNVSPISTVRNNGEEKTVARFESQFEISATPSVADARHQFLDLAGDGNLDVVQFDKPAAGFFERTNDDGWESFTPFKSVPNLTWTDPNLRFVDLTGDGHADILLTEDDVLTWYPSLAEEGFGPAIRIRLPHDEEKGPAVVFADAVQSIHAADLSGDGLTDIVRIRNGEICYWPNLGYGRFGAKVTMDNAPWFDAPEQFDQQRLRLADIDGSGTTDIIYLERNRVAIYRNECGNSWSAAEYLESFPAVDDLSSVTAVDLLGNGTACLVWSSPLPGNAHKAMCYIELMGKLKPHLLTRVANNLGAETHIEYAPSTKFYLADRRAGKPWITRLPFPVHVVERVVTRDLISRNRFATRYAYHHGYYDGVDREFRGFGMVEQLDTEEFGFFDDPQSPATNIDAQSHVPPVFTRTWFHTGVHLGRDHISNFFAGLLNENDKGEYYREPGLTNDEARLRLLDDTILPPGLTLEEEREACRALKGSMLRQEVYALDGSEKEAHPYSVSEQNFTVRLVQAKGENANAVFFTHSREALNYHYERNPTDPRISHTLTLEVDDWGNVLKSLAIGYGRRQRSTDEDLRDVDKDKQSQLQIVYTETNFTEPVLLELDHYRTPAPAETRTYELTGFKPDTDTLLFKFDKWAGNNFAELTAAVEIPYEQAADHVSKQKRLIETVRMLYRKDDLTDLLPLRRLDPLALPGESYQLALTPSLLAQVFKRKRAEQPDEDLLPNPGTLLTGDGGYTVMDGNWWISSGRVFYDPDANVTNPALTAGEELEHARNHFYLARKFTDPFGYSSVVEHDAKNDLLVTLVRDAAGNTVAADNDYRVLQPHRVTDPNGNRSAAAFDALGLLVATAVSGKEGEDVGDVLDGSFVTDPVQDRIEEFITNPREPATASESQATQISRDLLSTATTRIIYDLDRFRRLGEPPVAATLARETHFHAPGGNQTRIQISFSYSDGFGREIQKKIQAEPGPLSDGGSFSNPRWVGSGWAIFNNKGKPVRQYEPFFSSTHQFEFAKAIGVSPVLFYDPVERVIATIYPNNCYDKVSFDAWQQTSYDVNDTVLGDPRTDPHIAGYVRKYFETQPNDWQTWHAQRINNQLGTAERDAAIKAGAHTDTPAVAHFDSLGRAFLTLADNGPDPSDPTKHLKFATRVEMDVEGNQREVRDAKDRLVMRYDYDMFGNQIHQASMEAGERWALGDATGKPIRAWDSRGHTFRTEYDALRRATKSFVSGAADVSTQEICFNAVVYGDEVLNADPALNLREQVLLQCDSAGVVVSVVTRPGTNVDEGFDFKGNPLRTKRQLAREYKQSVDWNEIDWTAVRTALGENQFQIANVLQSFAPMLETEAFTSSVTYDALNRPVTSTAPDGSIYSPTFNEANLLERVAVNLRGAQPATEFVTNINYNAKGQRELIHYGNNAETTYDYDDLTFRLKNLRTTRPPADNSPILESPPIVQDLSYTYDPTGNITRIQDSALKTVFNNGPVAPVCQYRYDATYRLSEATGREHIGQTAHDFGPANRRDYDFVGHAHVNDLQAMRNYTEHYEYDEAGNFEFVRHNVLVGNGWTREYFYEEESPFNDGNSNRLTQTKVGNGFIHDEKYTYVDSSGNDVHGCMTSINDMKMVWNFKDQLQQVDLGGGGTAFYVYDASGQRVRKVIESQNGPRVNERTYLGDYEVYREFNGADVELERETLHVMDDKQRIALIETKTRENSTIIASPIPIQRYQLSNHLGSASLELDHLAKLISYEEFHPYGTTAFQARDSAAEVSLKRYRYTGMERDEETGFAYHGARYYAPWVGRWTACDPIGIKDGPDLYVYSRNRPTVLVDFSGTESRKLMIGTCKATDPQPMLDLKNIVVKQMPHQGPSMGPRNPGPHRTESYYAEFQRNMNALHGSNFNLVPAVVLEVIGGNGGDYITFTAPQAGVLGAVGGTYRDAASQPKLGPPAKPNITTTIKSLSGEGSRVSSPASPASPTQSAPSPSQQGSMSSPLTDVQVLGPRNKFRPRSPALEQSKDYTCASAACRMVLKDLGHTLTEDRIAATLNTTEKGARILDIPSALQRLNIPVSRNNLIQHVSVNSDASFGHIEQALGKGNRVIGSITVPGGFHAVVIDSIYQGNVFFRDPAIGATRSMSKDAFESVFTGRMVQFDLRLNRNTGNGQD